MREREREKSRERGRELPLQKNGGEKARWWWCTPLIPAFGRQRQVDLCLSSRSVWSELVPGQAPKPQRNPVSENQKNNRKLEKRLSDLEHLFL